MKDKIDKDRKESYVFLLVIHFIILTSFSLSQPYVIVEEGIASTRLISNLTVTLFFILIISIIFNLFSKVDIVKLYERLKKEKK